MNPKLDKYRAEREKNAKRIEVLQNRNMVLDEKITQLENSDIIGMVREINLTPEQLAQVLATLKTSPAAAMNGDLGVPGIDPKEGCEDAVAALHADDNDAEETVGADNGAEAEQADSEDIAEAYDEQVALNMDQEA